MKSRGRSATGDEPTFDGETLQDGLQLSLIGMGVVFAVLSILAISIKLFDRLDSLVPTSGAPERSTGASPAPAQGPAEVVEQPEPADEDAQTAAAIAVALALADQGQRPAPTAHRSAPVQTPGSGWLTTGRYREMSKRVSAPPGRGRRDR